MTTHHIGKTMYLTIYDIKIVFRFSDAIKLKNLRYTALSIHFI